MAISRKRILRYFLTSIAIVLSFFVLLGGAIVYVVFSPKVLTPLLVNAINEHIDGDVEIAQIDITFFSTFPDLQVKLDQATLFSDSLTDKTTPNNHVVRFDSCFVSFDLVEYFKSNQIIVHEFAIFKPSINGIIDKNGKANWDIITSSDGMDTTTTETDTSTTALDHIKLKSIKVIGADLIFEDLMSDVHTKANDINIQTSIDMDEEELEVDLYFDCSNVYFQDSTAILANGARTKFITKAQIDLSNMNISLDSTWFNVNNVELFAIGEISKKDSVALNLDISTSLKIPYLDSAITLIPPNYFDFPEKIKTGGSMYVNAKINGVYNEQSYPVVDLDFKVMNSNLEYQGLSNNIRNLDIDLTAKIDYSKATRSFVKFNNVQLDSKGAKFKLNGSLDDVFVKPYLSFKTEGDINLSQIKNTIPVDNIDLKGRLKFNLNSRFQLDDLLNEDYGKIAADGMMELKGIDVKYKRDSLIFRTKSSRIELGQTLNSVDLTQEKSNLFHGNFKFSHLKFKIKDQVDLSTARLLLSAKSTPWEDSTQIAELRSSFRVVDANLNLGDTVKINTPFTRGVLNISPGKINKNVPVFYSDFKVDSATANINGLHMAIKNGKYVFDFKRKSETDWPITGFFKFDRFFVLTPEFPKLIRMIETRIEIRHKRLILKKAKVRIGKSKMELTGRIFDIQETLFEEKPLKARFDIDSKFLNINQLIKIFNAGSNPENQQDISKALKEEEESIDEDSTSIEIFQIPKGIDIILKANFSRVIFSDMEFKDVIGSVVLKDGRVRLNKLNMKSSAGNMLTTIRYHPTSKKKATSSFNIKFLEIDVANLVQTMPFLDTLLPMAKSFEGQVNFGIRGRSKLNNNLEIIPSTVNAIARAEGKSLVLMDSETFAYVSKTLMFKNKERNMIDSADFQMSIKNGEIELYPSLVSIDRYNVAIGGLFNMNYQYQYQISILKSPAPFKAGIDIIGNEEDYDYKLTKAKYKHLFSTKEKQQKKADISILNKKADIISKIQFD